MTDCCGVESCRSTIYADQKRALAIDCGAQDGYVSGIPTHVQRQINRLDNQGRATQKCGKLLSIHASFGALQIDTVAHS